MRGALVAVLFAAVGAAAEEPGVRELKYDGVTFAPRKDGRPAAPVRAATAADLKAITADEASAAAVAKQVDFTKEEVLYFAWSGSGQDKLTVAVQKGEKGPVVTYHLVPGRTRDLRQHRHLYAVPKGAEVTAKP